MEYKDSNKNPIINARLLRKSTRATKKMQPFIFKKNYI